MFATHTRWFLPALLVAAAPACHKDYPTASRLQLDLMDESRSSAMGHLTDMSDNALLADMAIADFHFVGHSAELSGTGAARLERMACLLKHYGGTIHYETRKSDKALVDKRLEHVREYLKLAGCDMNKVTVEVGLAGGRGMAASDAIKVSQRGTGQSSESGAGVPRPIVHGSQQTN